MNTIYKQPIYFHIPAYFDNTLFTPEKNFYAILKNYSMDNIKLIVYGCPNTCTWNGGRYISSEMYRIHEVELMLLSLISVLGIDVQITFTNALLEKRDLYDRLGNSILEICSGLNEHIEVLVNSNILESYIRKEYPKIKIARSITRYTFPTKRELDGRYSTIVLPITYNHDIKAIKKIATQCNLEMLCDEDCVVYCQYRKNHYESFNKEQLYKTQNNKGLIRCAYESDKLNGTSKINPDNINDYIDLGVTHFKLSGREDTKKMIESCARYIVKPDNQIKMVYDSTNILNRYFRGYWQDKYISYTLKDD